MHNKYFKSAQHMLSFAGGKPGGVCAQPLVCTASAGVLRKGWISGSAQELEFTEGCVHPGVCISQSTPEPNDSHAGCPNIVNRDNHRKITAEYFCEINTFLPLYHGRIALAIGFWPGLSPSRTTIRELIVGRAALQSCLPNAPHPHYLPFAQIKNRICVHKSLTLPRAVLSGRQSAALIARSVELDDLG